jgi:spermidine synthase
MKTAVEWYSQQHLKLLIKLENKELSIGEYAVQHQEIYNHALEMESKKQQKYDEMLAMLEAFALMSDVIGMGKSIMAEQLIKEAKEL